MSQKIYLLSHLNNQQWIQCMDKHNLKIKSFHTIGTGYFSRKVMAVDNTDSVGTTAHLYNLA